MKKQKGPKGPASPSRFSGNPGFVTQEMRETLGFLIEQVSMESNFNPSQLPLSQRFTSENMHTNGESACRLCIHTKPHKGGSLSYQCPFLHMEPSLHPCQYRHVALTYKNVCLNILGKNIMAGFHLHSKYLHLGCSISLFSLVASSLLLLSLYIVFKSNLRGRLVLHMISSFFDYPIELHLARM